MLLLLLLLCADRHGLDLDLDGYSQPIFGCILACQPACYSKFQKSRSRRMPFESRVSVLLGSRCWELQELWMDSWEPTKAMLINPQVQLCWLL